jgi:hypothetical protein
VQTTPHAVCCEKVEVVESLMMTRTRIFVLVTLTCQCMCAAVTYIPIFDSPYLHFKSMHTVIADHRIKNHRHRHHHHHQHQHYDHAKNDTCY